MISAWARLSPIHGSAAECEAHTLTCRQRFVAAVFRPRFAAWTARAAVMHSKTRSVPVIARKDVRDARQGCDISATSRPSLGCMGGGAGRRLLNVLPPRRILRWGVYRRRGADYSKTLPPRSTNWSEPWKSVLPWKIVFPAEITPPPCCRTTAFWPTMMLLSTVIFAWPTTVMAF